MNVRPMHDRLVIRRLDDPAPSAGGIVIPDSAKEKPQRGTVIAAGSGKRTDEGKRTPLDVKTGDVVLFAKYAGQEIKIEGVEYLIIREDEILAAIDAPAAS